MVSKRQRMRQLVLDRQGLRKGRHGRLDMPAPVVRPVTDYEPLKTALMKRIERQYGILIEEVLVSGSLHQVAGLLEIDFTTVSKWKKRLGLT